MEWNRIEKKMSEWTVDGKGKYHCMDCKFLCVLVCSVKVHLYLSPSQNLKPTV